MDTFPISADVDSIIEIVRTAGGKGVDIRKLSSSIGKSVPETERWVHVLEEQGAVRVEHHFTRVHIYWTGKGTAASSEHQRAIERKHEHIEAPAQAGEEAGKAQPEGEQDGKENGLTLEQVEELLAHAKKIREIGSKAAGEFTLEMPEEGQIGENEAFLAQDEEKEIEKLAFEKENRKWDWETALEKAREIRPKKEIAFEEAGKGKNEDIAMPAKSSQIQTGAKEGETIAQGEIAGQKKQEVEELAQLEKDILARLNGLERAIDEQISKAQQEEESAEGQGEIGGAAAKKGEVALRPDASKIVVSKIPRRVDVGVSRFSGKLGEHLRAVNEVAQEIEELNAQKQKIARELYAPLEKKLEAELEVLATRLLQKEKTIMELRSRAAQIPIAAGELGQKHEKMAEIEKQMKSIVDESGIIIDEAREQVSSAMEEVQAKAEEVRRGLNSQYVRFEELKGAAKQVEQTRMQVEQMLQQAHAQLASEQQRVQALDENAANLAQMGQEIKANISLIWKDMGKQQAALSSMQEQLHRLAEVDRWAAQNEMEYKKNMVQIGEFVKNNEVEYLGLREEMEANFVRRYLRELRGITDSYEYEIGEAVRAEKAVDERIMDAKKRMEEMVQEGKRMAYLYELQLKEEAKEAYDEQRQKRERMFRALVATGGKRTQVEQMIGEIIGSVQAGGENAQKEIAKTQERQPGAQAAKPALGAAAKKKIKFHKKSAKGKRRR